MPSPLTDAQIEAQARLRGFTATAVERLWRELTGYDRSDVPAWLAQVLPVVTAAQRASVGLTDGYIARLLGRRPLGIDPDTIIAANRGTTTPEEVYERPFVTFWTALKAGSPDAFDAGLARAKNLAAFDVQAAMRDTAQEIGRSDPRIQRWQRVADGGACPYCASMDGAILNSDDALPIHPACGCGIEPLEEALPVTPTPADVAVQTHGEMGLTLSSPDYAFTGPQNF